MRPGETDVIICGAGPVGLTAAATLARGGAQVSILEKRQSLNLASKASTFHPPTLEILDRLGVGKVMRDEGCRVDRIAYLRAGNGGAIATFDLPAALSGDTTHPYRVHLEQAAVTPHLLARAEESGRATIQYRAEAAQIGERADGTAWVEDTTGARQTARFVLGADGAQSAVRDAMGLAQDGLPYPGRVLRVIVGKSLADHVPGLAPLSYVYTEDHRSISLLEMPDCWRIIIRVPPDVPEFVAETPAWWKPILREFLPEAADRIEFLGLDVYGARKMIVPRNRMGRIGLIGDAVHQTNTKGGMNMNCGIHDADAIARAILRQLKDAPQETGYFDAALDERLRVATDLLLPRTDRNVTGKGDWLDTIASAAAEPARARDYLLGAAMLDMLDADTTPGTTEGQAT